MSQNTTQNAPPVLRVQDIWNQQQKKYKTKKTRNLEPEEGVLELPTPG